MCKLIKKSCFVIALSFMSFAFYSVDVNAALSFQKLASPRNSASDEHRQLFAEIYEQNTKGGEDILIGTVPVDMDNLNQSIGGFRAKQNFEYTIKYTDLKGKVYGTEKLKSEGQNLKAVLPEAVIEEAAPAAAPTVEQIRK